jgi:hypothetical protein
MPAVFVELSCLKSIKTQSKVTLEILSLKHQHCVSIQHRVSNP